ncbi:hypothetical protein CLF_102754 [Clonorchis sinensis]|uniref:Uncharacterized protein n=1 Tax=Clonorchis sinensis TaxID=79923 RepID=G7Y8G1_CLOSI|nr:hypothetical protein CLF_102754 [Clonorchis sinensis]
MVIDVNVYGDNRMKRFVPPFLQLFRCLGHLSSFYTRPMFTIPNISSRSESAMHTFHLLVTEAKDKYNKNNYTICQGPNVHVSKESRLRLACAEKEINWSRNWVLVFVCSDHTTDVAGYSFANFRSLHKVPLRKQTDNVVLSGGVEQTKFLCRNTVVMLWDVDVIGAFSVNDASDKHYATLCDKHDIDRLEENLPPECTYTAEGMTELGIVVCVPVMTFGDLVAGQSNTSTVKMARRQSEVVYPTDHVYFGILRSFKGDKDNSSSIDPLNQTLFHRDRRKPRLFPVWNSSEDLTSSSTGFVKKEIIVPESVIFEPEKDLYMLYPNSPWLDPCKARTTATLQVKHKTLCRSKQLNIRPTSGPTSPAHDTWFEENLENQSAYILLAASNKSEFESPPERLLTNHEDSDVTAVLRSLEQSDALFSVHLTSRNSNVTADEPTDVVNKCVYLEECEIPGVHQFHQVGYRKKQYAATISDTKMLDQRITILRRRGRARLPCKRYQAVTAGFELTKFSCSTLLVPKRHATRRKYEGMSRLRKRG